MELSLLEALIVSAAILGAAAMVAVASWIGRRRQTEAIQSELGQLTNALDDLGTTNKSELGSLTNALNTLSAGVSTHATLVLNEQMTTGTAPIAVDTRIEEAMRRLSKQFSGALEELGGSLGVERGDKGWQPRGNTPPHAVDEPPFQQQSPALPSLREMIEEATHNQMLGWVRDVRRTYQPLPFALPNDPAEITHDAGANVNLERWMIGLKNELSGQKYTLQHIHPQHGISWYRVVRAYIRYVYGYALLEEYEQQF